MKLLKTIFSQKTQPLQAFVELKLKIDEERKRWQFVCDHVSALAVERDKARAKFFESVTIEDFDSFRDANNRYETADQAFRQIGGGEFGSRLEKTAESTEILRQALSDCSKRLSKELQGLERSLADALEQAGAPATGQHSALTAISDKIQQLNSAAAACANYTPNHSGGICPWTRFSKLIEV